MARGNMEVPAGFQLRIGLRQILPAVWRRFLVPGGISLPVLHRTLQDVMGWENRHLHLFRFGEDRYGDPDPEFPSDLRNQRGRRLREFIRADGDMFGYVYDFGDNWEHDVVVERIVGGTGVTGAKCLEGERACPPEDVGGPYGYMDYLEAIRDPSHPRHRELVTRRGPSFDPERFDLAGINCRLSRWSRSRREAQGCGKDGSNRP